MNKRSGSAQRGWGVIKGFAEPINCKQEQEIYESAYCKRKAYITQADKELDANWCNW